MTFINPQFTKDQIRNLETLAEYLLTIPDGDPSFSMRTYTDDFAKNFISHRNESDRTDCGTVGCAIGHGPYAGIPKDKGDSWDLYAELNFGASIMRGAHRKMFEWCFDPVWACSCYPTARDCANRIIFAINKGIPEKWRTSNLVEFGL